MPSTFVTLGARDGGRENNLNLVRFVAASLVVLSHSFPLSGHQADEPLARLTGFMDFGGLAVTVFFAISGYLVAGSFDRSSGLHSYARARFLRIAPAYAVAVLYAALVVGPIVTTLPIGQYLTHPATWRYIGTTLTFFGDRDSLPGVFALNPFPVAVNGSLWTLSIETFCYAALALLGLTGALRRPWLALAIAVALFAVGEASPDFVAWIPRSEYPISARLAGTFVAGALAYAWRRRVVLSPWIALAALAALPVLAATPIAAYAVFGAIGYAALTLGYHPALDVPAFRRHGDVSYGVYVYAFPTQQFFAWMTGPISPWLLFALAFPPTLALAALSWRWIEAPALRFKRRRVGGAPADGCARSSEEQAQYP